MLLAGLAVVVHCLLPVQQGRLRPVGVEPADESVLLSFSAPALRGSHTVSLRDGRVGIDGANGATIAGVETRSGAPVTGDPGQVVFVRNQHGRASVEVVQQPRADNGNEVRVRIDDYGGSEPLPLRFDLVAGPARAAPHPFNVLVMTLDSLRPDRLGCYGYARQTSPHLDEFARQSVRFTNAFSPSSFTPPSHASLLTSRYVGDHGLLTWNELPNDALTLPEILSRYGYRTGASVNLQLLSKQDLGQGVAWRREGQRDGGTLVEDALEFMRGAGGRPWFLWLHLYDVHRPYRRVAPGTRAGGDFARPDVGDVVEDYDLRPADVRKRGFDDRDIGYIVERYDSGVVHTDALLAPLLAELSTPERTADTLVIVTADHGESLVDHPERYFTHDPFLFAAVTRIPFLVRFPGGRDGGTVRDDVISLIDVGPTVLDLLGVAAPSVFQGVSLARLGADAPLQREGVYQECWGWEELKALRTRDELVLYDVADGTTRFFDLVRDPGELRPLRQAPTAAARRRHEELLGFARGSDNVALPRLSAETIEQLRVLGYTED